MSRQEQEDDEFSECNQFTDFVSVVCKPTKENFFEDKVQLLKHSVPVYQPEQLEVEDVSLFKCHETWNGRDAVQDEVALDILHLSISQLDIDTIFVLLLG